MKKIKDIFEFFCFSLVWLGTSWALITALKECGNGNPF